MRIEKTFLGIELFLTTKVNKGNLSVSISWGRLANGEFYWGINIHPCFCSIWISNRAFSL